jgi:hypothetical protein
VVFLPHLLFYSGVDVAGPLTIPFNELYSFLAFQKRDKSRSAKNSARASSLAQYA